MMKHKILVIDDSMLCLSLIKTLIKESYFYHSVDLTLCDNASIAIDKLSKHTYDIVVTDIVMPEFNGYELITHIKQNYQVPVIAISSGYGERDPALVLEAAKEFGADDTLYKFDLKNDLVNVLSLYIKQAA
ncbi:response regulator [Vibrio sp. S4M6]|uniref:response regulator n=1 Tax=Vibrio sinus TaxID=2946865 RepID=UPI00202A7A65|nr:response regulator [Vibrio sinus]MCL9781739.1 response regulator [Vibrio sinus]